MMMSAAALLAMMFFVLTLASLAVVSGSSIAPTPWSEVFSIGFQSNITKDGTRSASTPVSGKMLYDWTQQMQRVDHDAGSYECVVFYGSNQPCTLFFTPNGMYRTLSGIDFLTKDPTQEQCCLDLDFIHASAPTWAVDAQPTFVGTVKDVYSNHIGHKFKFDYNGTIEDASCHLYTEMAEWKMKGAPLIFTFPVDDGRQDYRFLPETYVTLSQSMSPSTFSLPEGCEKKMCSSSTKGKRALLRKP